VTGVLPVCIGKATKLIDYLMDSPKEYRAVMRLGIKTDTLDMTGNVLEKMCPEEVAGKVSEQKIAEAFNAFTGTISQIPPMYSAVKVNGVKLVDAARKGKELERKPRTAEIFSYSDIDISPDRLHVSFTVRCSKGTYIRTLCEDMGAFMGIPACMESLVRTETSGFKASTAITLDMARALAAEGKLEDYIVPTDRLLKKYVPLEVTEEAEARLIYGNYMYPEDIKGVITEDPNGYVLGLRATVTPHEGEVFRLYGKGSEFYALYRYDSADQCYKCDKMFK
ncbi:MAG: tRNA pseudouridine(55) synthase TruB, partial [Parasporobacterium sp.]|nr:tRNA pseudouridine(55) synthase TruB [Parasporobacterium sp.]